MTATALAVKERGILFSGPMVRALLADEKRETRRPIANVPPETTAVEFNTVEQAWVPWKLGTSTPGSGYRTGAPIKCPYGKAGDRLYVRESGWLWGRWRPNGKNASGRQRWKFVPVGQRWAFEKPDKITCWGNDFDGFTARPGIHMPRWASRILLEITDIRAERLQKITEGGARAEGAPMVEVKAGSMGIAGMSAGLWRREGFAQLWNSLNAARGLGWQANPWVWVVSFRRTS